MIKFSLQNENGLYCRKYLSGYMAVKFGAVFGWFMLNVCSLYKTCDSRINDKTAKIWLWWTGVPNGNYHLNSRTNVSCLVMFIYNVRPSVIFRQDYKKSGNPIHLWDIWDLLCIKRLASNVMRCDGHLGFACQTWHNSQTMPAALQPSVPDGKCWYSSSQTWRIDIEKNAMIDCSVNGKWHCVVASDMTSCWLSKLTIYPLICPFVMFNWYQ